MERTQHSLDLFSDALTVIFVTTDKDVWGPLFDATLNGADGSAISDYAALRHLHGKAEGVLYTLGEVWS